MARSGTRTRPPTEGLSAGATSGETPSGFSRPKRQREAERGSYSFDDPDRKRWDTDTRLEQAFDYHDQNDRYAYSKLKGRRSDGDKAFLTGRLLGGNDLQIAKQEEPHGFYNYPDLTHYLKGAGDEPDMLYRLPELVRDMAARPAEIVFICEGEKDVDTLCSLDLIATTNPNGATNWKPEYNQTFASRHVAVLTDNDDKGRTRGAMLARELGLVAASVRLVELPGLRVNGDVTDWLQDGNGRADLLREVEATEATTLEDRLVRDRRGNAEDSIENARLALAILGVTVRYDEFAARYTVAGLPGFGPVLDDAALTRLRLQAEERLQLAFAKERWADIVTDHARDHACHPVREYLSGLRHDDTPRLDRWLIDYAGAEDSDYVRAVSAICLIAAVRRVREPGCKFDEMLVIEGEQGGGKSQALAMLAVHEEWFADDLPLDADSKTVMERTAGRWINELAELKGLRRGVVEHVKGMISRRVDKARLAYGRMTTEQPRQCIFVGTTNDAEYLRDMTGNRRFWPVRVGEFDLAALRRDRDQLWAEAAAREAARESIRLPEHLWAAAGEQQASREVGDPFYERLSERLDGHDGKVRAGDIWEVVGLGDVGRRSQDDNVRLSAAMHKLGWRRPKSKLRFDGRPQNAWVKGDVGVAVDAYPEVPRAVVLGSERPL